MLSLTRNSRTCSHFFSKEKVVTDGDSRADLVRVDWSSWRKLQLERWRSAKPQMSAGSDPFTRHVRGAPTDISWYIFYFSLISGIYHYSTVFKAMRWYQNYIKGGMSRVPCPILAPVRASLALPKPSSRHTTVAARMFQLSSQTVPHSPFFSTSTRPSPILAPPFRRTRGCYRNSALKEEKKQKLELLT